MFILGYANIVMTSEHHLTPEFVLAMSGKLRFVYELIRQMYQLIVKIKFIIHNYYW